MNNFVSVCLSEGKLYSQDFWVVDSVCICPFDAIRNNLLSIYTDPEQLAHFRYHNVGDKEDGCGWNFMVPDYDKAPLIEGNRPDRYAGWGKGRYYPAETLRRNTSGAFSHVSVLVLDYDGTISMDDFEARFKNELSYVLHTSHSHRSDEKKGKDCFRVLLELSEPIAIELLTHRTIGSLQPALISAFECDASSFEPTRGFLRPWLRSEDAPFEVRSSVPSARPFDWRAEGLAPTPKSNRKSKPKPPPDPNATRGGAGVILLYTLDLDAWFSARDEITSTTGKEAVVPCPNAAEHTSQGSEAKIFQTDNGEWGFKCWHGHCTHLGTAGIKELLLKQHGEAIRPFCETRISTLPTASGATLPRSRDARRKYLQNLLQQNKDST